MLDMMPNRPALFQTGDFTLNSGAKSAFKIECDSLTDADWETIALMLNMILRAKDIRFCTVRGVPRGGLKLAEALKKYRSTIESSYGMDLICDDVLTTGGSMNRTRTEYMRSNLCQVTGVVFIARGPCPDWIIPLCQLPKELWLPGAQDGHPNGQCSQPPKTNESWDLLA